MSPERLRGEDYGPAADIWSLGLVLLELATRQVQTTQCTLLQRNSLRAVHYFGTVCPCIIKCNC
jgi:serine/threonine protein kinase